MKLPTFERIAKKMQFLMLFTVFAVSSAFGQCPTGDIVLNNQAAINNFGTNYPGCTQITGTLTIGSTAGHIDAPDITDLSPLNGITHITGNLNFNNLSGLQTITLNNLQQVGGNFLISSGATALTTASFNGITTIGGAFTLSAPNLTTLSGMNNLTSVGGQMLFHGIGGNPTLPAFTNLTTITGNLFFQNTALTSISGFPALQTIGGNFQVAQNSGLIQTISGFGSLTQIGGIVIGNASANNAHLKSFQIGGASPITVTGDVTLQANNQNSPEFLINGLSLGNIISVGGNITLQSIKSSTVTGFQNLQTVGGGISISSASNLTALDFGNLSGALSGALNISGAPALTSITGLSGLTSIGGFFNISSGSALTQLSIPNNLTSVGGNFTISGTGFASISGFNSLQSINGDFLVSSNSALTQVSGFNNLTTINGNFNIGGPNNNQGNAALTQISGFGSLNTLGGRFDIYANSQLQTVNLSGSTIGTVNGYLRLASNGNNLSTVNLGNITAVADTSPNNYLWLQNIAASTITGLNLNSVGGNVTVSNTSLTSLPFLNGLTSITGNLAISNNNALTSLSGFSSLTSVGGNLVFQQNSGLTSLSGLENLTSVGGNLDLNANFNLASLSALSNLTSINGTLRVIGANNQLASLHGLHNIASGITNLIIQNNSNLDLCSLSNLCTYLSNDAATHPRSIVANKAGGNCINVNAVLANCAPPCDAPTALTATGVTVSSANLGWASTGSSFDVQYGTSGFTLGNGILVSNVAGTSYSISGLSYNTAYQFYVRQNCDENQSEWAGPYEFTTPVFCPPGNYTLKTQAEVNNFLTTNPGCTAITGNLVIGQNNITYGNTDITDLSPLVGLTHVTGNLIIRRNYNITEINLPNLVEVGGDITITEENQLASVNFPNLTTVGRHFGFSILPALGTISGLNNLISVGGNIHFERIRQTTPAPTPNSLVLPSFTNLQSIGGNLRFLNIYGLNTYTNAFPNLQSIGGTFHVSINGIGPSGLEVFKGFNSLTSIGSMDFSTNQSGLQTFEILGTAPITVTGDVHFAFNNFPVFAINNLHLGNITSVGGKAHFRNVAADFTGFNPTSIGGYLYIHNSGLTSVAGFSNLTSLGGNLHLQYIPSLASVAEFENLTSVAGEIQIRQMGTLTSLEGLHNIDPSGITNLIIQHNGQLSTCELSNFCAYLSNPNNPRTIFANKVGGSCVNEAVMMAICIPPCEEPVNLSATNLTANTATLGWSTSGDFELEWGPAGFTFGEGNAVNGNGNFYNLTGLNPSTQYEFYVRQDCEINQSNWAGPFPFTTEGYCTPVPYVSSQSYGIYINSFSTASGAENINNANSGFSSGGYGNYTSLTTSQHIGEFLSFTMMPGSDSYPQGMRIWADWNNDGIFDESEILYTSQNVVSGTQSGSFIVPSVAEGSYRMRVMIKYGSNSIDPCETMFYGETEDYTFTVLPAPPCPSPTGINASTIGVNTADLSWNGVNNAQNYNWIVVLSGENPDTASPAASGNTSATSASVSGLASETIYDFYVKSDCDADGQSNWSAPFSFTTEGTPLRFVKPVASGTGDGSSWANASDDLQKMINGNGTEEVWVAAGTYKPIRRADNLNVIAQEDRDNAFVLKNNVKIYGGFTGTETELSQRDFIQNISILSGDFNSNGVADNDDAHHVVVIAGNLGTATLDGFTVTGGNANGSGNIFVNGRTISRAHSGGINIVQSTISLKNLTVTANNGQYGGGIFLVSSPASLTDLKVTNNTSQSGAGIKFDNSAVNLTNMVITGNVAGTYGGGIDIYGTPSPTLTNVTISGNVAESGGGICTNLSSPIIRNSVIYGNNTGLVNLTPGYAVTYSNSLVEGVTTNSNGNIDGSTDPLFTNMPDATTAPFAGGDYTLQLCSPIINKGNNTHITGTNSDISGNPRIYNNTVDLGAYEVQQGSTAPTNLYAGGLHTTTVTLGWESDSELFDIEWGEQGFTQGSGTLVSGLTVNSYTLTDLVFDTTYEFYVRESCGGNQSEWSAPFAFTPVYSVCPLGYIAFNTQAQVDAFGATYNSCNVTTGHLVINGNDITNLAPLANIVQVGGNFHVHNNAQLQNFNGLHNIKSIGGYIRIHNNAALTSIAALTLNEQPGGVLDSYFLIEHNPALTSLDGLESITEITSYLRIHNNPALADMDALNGMTGIGTSTATTLTYRGVSIQGTAITALPDWSLMTQINQELNISDNPNLTSLHGLHNITSVATYLRIHNNGVTNLDALSNLTAINGNLTLHGASLVSASGLSNLSGDINGQLMIDNTGLTTLDGLQNITSLGGQLFIRSNPNLTTLDTLANLDADSIANLTIRDNASLSECSIDSLCEYLSNDPATHPRYIVNNSGTCLNTAAVIAACPSPVLCPTGNLTFNTQAQLDQFKLDYPNCTEIAGHVLISGGLSVNNLDGFSNIEKINGGFTIWANHNLQSLEGLEKLTAIASTLTIYNNTTLKNVDALANLTSVGVGLDPVMTPGAAHLVIQHNRDLENLDGLSNLTKFGGNLTIENNQSLENIDGLASISTGNTPNLLPNVIKSISLRYNASLVNIDALSHITRIGYLYVIGNDSLENLNGLSNVTQAVGSVSIVDNAVLNDISGLGNLDINLIFGNHSGYNTGLGVVIVDNTTLSVCNLPTNLCTYLAGPKRREISGNLTGCADEEAALNACQGCELPMNPTATLVTAYTANFAWNAPEDTEEYTWVVVSDNEDPETADPVSSGDTSDLTAFVSDLEAETAYDFYVRAGCTPTGESNWASRVDFLTAITCPAGNVFLTTQAQVDEFSTLYAGCSVISGNLTIGYGSPYSSTSDIEDLSPLANIAQITGNLIIRNNPQLQTLNGLNSLAQLGGNMEVSSNSNLLSVTALSSLSSIPGSLDLSYNDTLNSLSGLNNITTVGTGLNIFANHGLTSLNGLGSLSYVGGNFSIGFNDSLESLEGTGNLVALGESLDISHNAALISVNGLNISTIGRDLRIWDNAVLENLNALSTVTTINGSLQVQENPELTDISGLGNIDYNSIGGALGLHIQSNPNLTVCGLANFCSYLAGSGPRTIADNAGDCFNEAAVISFCTPVCDAPEDGAVTSVTTTSAGFSWIASQDANAYTWVVIAAGENPDTATHAASGNTSGTTASAQELTPATTYDFYVKTDCELIDSEWSGPYSFTTYSPDYSIVELTGFNTDVIAEGVQHPSTTTTNNIDGYSNVFYNQTYGYNFVSPINYLPANGAFSSAQTAGLPYQLAPATGNNALRLAQGQSGTLNFLTPVPAKTVFALITSGGSSSIVNLTVNFEDGTSQQFNQVNVSDWFNGNGYAIKGIGRVERSGYHFQDLEDNPRIYEIELQLEENNHTKNITGVTFQRISNGTAITSIMGISIEDGIIPECTAPESVSVMDIMFSSADFSWEEADYANQYQWIVVADGTDPDNTTPVASGNTPDNTISVTDLEPGTAYDFYVKSICGGSSESEWSLKTDFTTLSACPEGDLTFTSQQEVDEFLIYYPNCTQIQGFVKASGEINNLNGLVNITSIGGKLEVSNTEIENLDALAALESVGGLLSLTANSLLTNVHGLNSLQTIGGSLDITLSTQLENLTGLSNLESVGGRIFIGQNANLTDISDLQNIDPASITGTEGIRIENNAQLSVCNLPNFCTYLENPDNPRSIFGNVGSCISSAAIESICLTGNCASYTIWDGNAWGNGEPDSNKGAAIYGDLTLNTNFEACELRVRHTGTLQIPSGFTFTVNGQITNQGAAENFVVASGGNLIQIDEVTNLGEITVIRESQPMIRLDYTMWSSPVTGQNLFGFSPLTVNGVTNHVGSQGRIYIYDGALGYVNPNPYDTETAMNEGVGYLFRSPNNYSSDVAVPYNGVFTGVPFNGNLSVATHVENYTSVGNPYPSNIDADEFILGNPGVATLYFWNNNVNSGSNYATCTLGNCVAAGNGYMPNGIISVGQGFIVGSFDNSVSFNNSMRVDDTATFFKVDETERHRFWLDLNDEENQMHNQILVSYMTGATHGIDHQMDGKLFGYEGSALYNIIEEEKFVIQGRGLPFETADVVPLGFRAENDGKFKISLTNFDGLFAESEVIIYIKDKELNFIHNLMESDYEFESLAGEFEERFEIIYETESTMGTTDLMANGIQIYRDQDKIVVSSEFEKILSVELFDMQGRNVHRNDKVNAKYYQIRSEVKGVLVVRVQTQNGEVVTKKIINK